MTRPHSYYTRGQSTLSDLRALLLVNPLCPERPSCMTFYCVRDEHYHRCLDVQFYPINQSTVSSGKLTPTFSGLPRRTILRPIIGNDNNRWFRIDVWWLHIDVRCSDPWRCHFDMWWSNNTGRQEQHCPEDETTHLPACRTSRRGCPIM